MASRTNGHGAQASMVKIAEHDPQLAGRLFVAALPASAASVRGNLRYRLELADVGSYDISLQAGKVAVMEIGAARSVNGADQPTMEFPAEQPTVENDAVEGPTGTELVPVPNGKVDFVLRTDAMTLARLAAGTSPLKLMLGGKLRISGKRRRAMKLRQMTGNMTMRDIARAGVNPDPDLLYRALPYAIDPAWTRGEHFCIAYEISADESGSGGVWYLLIDDGRISASSEPPAVGVDSTVRLAHQTWLSIVRGDLAPGDAIRFQHTQVDGKMHPVTLFGRWVERAEGRDERELMREMRQRAVQEGRATWGSKSSGNGPGAGDPAVDARKKGVQLLSYEELYALWERQNWKAHEIDFSVDKQHWLTTPTEAQRDTVWSLASFYIGEQRVAADLAPFVLAAPSGEVEIFLATQLVDEARHAAFFDRFMAEVMALEPNDIRSRLATLESGMAPAWKELFDGDLLSIAKQIQAKPDDMDLFVEGIVTYHMVIEGVLAMTGQHQILKYLTDHDLYPGFREGFSRVERDEHRHIAFGVRFLRDAVEADARYRDLIERKIAELVPHACHVLVPPDTPDPANFVSYDYSSAQIYGFAYRALRRRMAVVGVEVPPAQELMPGPID